MNTDAIIFTLFAIDALLIVACIVALTASRIHDDEVRLTVLASLPVAGKPLVAAYRWFTR